MTDPLVSVIIPTYNRGRLLVEAVESVRRQTEPRWECVVVDDGSTDNTAQRVTALGDARVRLIHAPHSGNPARGRNLGIAQARGRYVAFLDNDDLWLSDKLASQVPLLEGGALWCYGGWALADAQGRPSGKQSTLESLPEGWILERMLSSHAGVAIQTVTVERRLLDAIGWFDEQLLYRDDFDFCLRLASVAPGAAVPRPLALIREHPGRISRTSGDALDRTISVYRHWLPKLRDAAPRAACRRKLGDLYLTRCRILAESGAPAAAAAALARALGAAPGRTLTRGVRWLRSRLSAST